MSVRIVRTIGGPPTGTDADPVQPRLDVAALPYSAPCLLGFALNATVPAPRVLRPIQCKAIPNEPFAEIGTADRAHGYRAPVAVETDRIAVYGSPRNERVEVVSYLRAASISIAIFAPTELSAFRRVDAPEPNAVAVDFECIAINDARLSDQVIGKNRSAARNKRHANEQAFDPSRKSVIPTS